MHASLQIVLLSLYTKENASDAFFRIFLLSQKIFKDVYVSPNHRCGASVFSIAEKRIKLIKLRLIFLESR